MLKFKYLPMLLISTTALANGNVPGPVPVAEAPKPGCAWSYYAGFAGGIDVLQGHRGLVRKTPLPEVNLSRKHHLNGNAGYVELYTGATYWLPGSVFGLGLDPYVAYSNVKSNDFHNTALVEDDLVFNESNTSSWAARLAFGADLKASLKLNQHNSLSAFVGPQVREFEFKYQDPLGSGDSDRWLWAFAWGVSYEHRFNLSSIGIKFRNAIFQKKKIHFNFEGSTLESTAKPRTYSVMLTYKYSFCG